MRGREGKIGIITFHHSTIVSIKRTGLTYIDNQGVLLKINFNVCRKHWVKYVNSSIDFEKSDLTDEETFCVGWRDAFDKIPYIEFFTEPRTRFVFPYKRTFYEWYRKSHSHKGYMYFRGICKDLEACGWSTFDLG